MAFTRIQSSKGTKAYVTDTTVSATLTGVTAGNNLVVVCGSARGAGTLTVSDDQLNSYSSQSSVPLIWQSGIITISVAANVASGTTVITATRSDANLADLWILAIEYNISDGIAVFQDYSEDANYGTATNSGNATATDTALLIGTTHNEARTPTVGGSWTSVDSYTNYSRFTCFEQLGVSAGDYNITSTVSSDDNWTNMIAIIQSDGSGGGGGSDGAAMYYYNMMQG